MSHQSGNAPRNLYHFIDDAWRTVPEITPSQAKGRLDRGEIDLLLDVREREELEAGYIPGSVHAPRGLLEWYADPASAQAKPEITALRGDATAHIAVYCTGGGRSLLAAQTLQRMGYANVTSIGGGFDDWSAQGLPVAGEGAPAVE